MSSRRKPSKSANGTSTPSSLSRTKSPSTTTPANGTMSDLSTPKAAPKQPTHPAYLPTPAERLLLGAYPATLALGSLFSLLDPASRRATYDAATHSYPAHAAPSFFARKRNPFNVFFVKLGWLWTTLALLAFLFTRGRRGGLDARKLRGVGRWAAATAWWVAVTQWFFGPGLIDRGFGWTGGVCELARKEGGRVGERIYSSRACRDAGGRWAGGHDISGHVFILILSTGMLLFETLPVVARDMFGVDRVVLSAGGADIHAADLEVTAVGPGAQRSDDAETDRQGIAGWATLFAFVVVGLEWFMLFNTAAYFHTWFEKFTGLLVSMVGLWTIYFLPRLVVPIRNIVGMPGL